jgi:hypothetical protein
MFRLYFPTFSRRLTLISTNFVLVILEYYNHHYVLCMWECQLFNLMHFRMTRKCWKLHCIGESDSNTYISSEYLQNWERIQIFRNFAKSEEKSELNPSESGANWWRKKRFTRLNQRLPLKKLGQMSLFHQLWDIVTSKISIFWKRIMYKVDLSPKKVLKALKMYEKFS